jgi:N-acyl amino acid synthase FeeM
MGGSILAALAKRHPVDNSIGGDTITAIPRTPDPIRLCVEDPDSRQLETVEQANLFKIRLANTEERQSAASYLIRRRYAWRGYAVGEQPRALPSRITIAAYDNEGTAGTVTVGLDASEPMFVDGLYADEANRLRGRGRRLAEFTRLAIDNNVHSKPLLAALFHIAFIYARRMHRCTDLLIEVNPRHETFYRRALGFEAFGSMRGDPRVGAPAVLLRLPLEHAEAEIARHGGTANGTPTTRSLYPYAFGPHEETRIERRLRALG